MFLHSMSIDDGNRKVGGFLQMNVCMGPKNRNVRFPEVPRFTSSGISCCALRHLKLFSYKNLSNSESKLLYFLIEGTVELRESEQKGSKSGLSQSASRAMFDTDLADRVDDLICTFDNGNPDSDMDTISILLTGWITFLFSSVLLMKYIYRKYKSRGQSGTSPETKKCEEEKVSATEKFTVPVQNGTSEKQQMSFNVHSTKDKGNGVDERKSDAKKVSTRSLRCSGPTPVVVEFVTSVHDWLYGDEKRKEEISDRVNSLFLKSVNKIFHGISHESTFGATVDDLSLSDDLSLQNLFAEYEDLNTIKITCDCEAKFRGYLTLTPISLGREESKYEFIVNRLIGRLKFLLYIEDKFINFKFDGWPEICLSIATTSNIETRLDPKTSEVITSKLSSALRNATVEIELDELENFPILPTLQTQQKTKRETPFLHIQLNRGMDIGLHKDCDNAYCVIELDDPAQKFQSRPRNLPNPIWNESYVLDTGSSSDCEVLFEVYSSIGGNFLGCHIVSVDQIVDGRKEVLRLKSRRVKVAENITGTLEVVFKFVGKTEALPYPNQQINNMGNKEAGGSSINVISILDDGLTIKPPTRPPRHTTTKLEDQYGEERGRRRKRRGDIFTSLRRRFSKERSKSVVTTDVPGSMDLQSNSTRSVSVDRPGVRGFGSDSTRSSASELSHYSSHSTSTFMHESSTLLIESIENGVKKYYLIPPEQVGTGQWKNKKKLHIFNDHTFVARRIQSGLSCTVCFGRFPFSLRKQGYQCRDCRLISHKECHIRIPTFCVKSTIYDIDVITV